MKIPNAPCNFQNSCAVETSLSDLHTIGVAVMKVNGGKLKTKTIDL